MRWFNKRIFRTILLSVLALLIKSYAAGAGTIDNIRKEYVNVKFSIPSFGTLINITGLKINGFSIAIPAGGQTETGWIELTNNKDDSLSFTYGYSFNNFKGCTKSLFMVGGGISFGDPPVPDPSAPQVDYYWTVEFYVSYTFTNVIKARYNMEKYQTLEKKIVQ